jgi:ribosome maturation factor RimP
MHGGSRHGSRGQGRSGPRSAGARGSGPRDASPRSGGSRDGQAKAPARPPVPLPDADRLTRLLEPVVHALGLDLEGIRVSAAGRRRLLRVTVDADGGVSLDVIATASRELSARLDGAVEMGELPYTLEVSSPGVDRPLTEPRHWRRAIGRLVVAPLSAENGHHAGNGVTGAEGRITTVTERGVTLDHDGVLHEYGYADLGPGKVQVEFGHLEPGEDEVTGKLDDELPEEDQAEED